MEPMTTVEYIRYLEWGTRMARMFSAEGADRVVHTPMPRWGWGLTPPYVPNG